MIVNYLISRMPFNTLIRQGSLFWLVFIVTACATVSPPNLPEIPELENQPKRVIPDVDMLALTPGMKTFAERHSNGDGPQHGKAWSLAYAVMDPYIFDFDYDPRITLPADRTFEHRTGNCLSFSSMFISMARDVGLTAYFQEVEILPTWRNVGDNLLVGKHVNAVIVDGRYRFTVDVSGRVGREIDRTRRLSDAEAKAQFYNNLAVDGLIEKDLALAYAYFHKALEIDLHLSYIWANLGVVLRRNGQTEEAILAYKAALELDPNERISLNNLLLIYIEDENLEAAEEIRDRVDRNQRRNPYYVQHLAELAIEEQRFSDAIDLARKAIRMDDNEYRFYYTLARSQYRAGERNASETSLSHALKLAPDQETRGQLVLPGEDY